jgi:hypothetical protein
MSKLAFRLGVGITLVALALVVTDQLLTPPLTPGVTEANVNRLRVGMTVTEVEAILGPLPRRSGFDPPFGPSGGWFGDGDSRPLGGLIVGTPEGPKVTREAQIAKQAQPASPVRTSGEQDAPREPDPDDLEAGVKVLRGLVLHGGGQARATEEALQACFRMGVPMPIPGKDGTAFLSIKDDRLRGAEWRPNPGVAVPRTGLIGRLRDWLSW